MFKRWLKNWFNRMFSLLAGKPTATIVDQPVRSIKYDTSKFTQGDYDYIIKAKEAHDKVNASSTKENRLTQADLTTSLNVVLNKSKSRSSYARVWNGKVSKDTLPTSDKEF